MPIEAFDYQEEDIEYVLISVTRRKARKDHACQQCPRPIIKGSTYERVVGKVDGDMTWWKRHNEYCWMDHD